MTHSCFRRDGEVDLMDDDDVTFIYEFVARVTNNQKRHVIMT